MKKSELQEKFEMALKKGLESESVALQTAAIKATADMLNPNLGELQTQLKQAQDRLSESKSLLNETQAERDGLLPLREQAAKVAPLQEQLDKVLAEQTEWKAEQTRLLTGEVTQKLFAAQAVLRASEETLREANNKVSSSGWQELRATLADLIARYEIPQPSFWETSNAMPSAFWTLWPDWTPRRAAVWCALKSSWSTDSPEFRAAALRVFLAAHEVFPGEPPRDVVPDLAERKSFFEVQSKRFGNGCYEEIAKQSEAYRIQRHGQFLRNHNLQLAAQQNDLATQGYGREPIRVEEKSVTGCPLSEHVLGCPCMLCGGRDIRNNSMDEII
jgi:hypothetical protein